MVALSRALTSYANQSSWDAWRNAVYGARMLQDWFPLRFVELVAGQPATIQRLAGASMVFLREANQELVELYISPFIEWSGAPPADLMARALGWDEAEALTRMDEEISSWLCEPTPALYGLGHDIAEELGQDSPGAFLAAGLWRLCQSTSLSITDWYDDEGMDAMLEMATSDPARRAILTQIPCLHGRTNVNTLCERLNTNPCAGFQGLGGMLEYAHGQTGESCADTSNFELQELYTGTSDLDWDDDEAVLDYQRGQKVARAYRDAFEALAVAIDADPARLLDVCRAITRVANQPWPSDVTTPDQTLIALLKETPDEETEAINPINIAALAPEALATPAGASAPA